MAIIGGGMAGGTLARQLALRMPDLHVGVFERTDEAPHKLGESMVELSSNYFVRKLGLSSYLYDRQYPKNGLRFFFDSPSLDQPLAAMSEIGSEALPFHPAFQIDRATLDADLRAMNARAGVRVRTGVRVHDVALGEGGEPHRFTATGRDGAERFEARWLLDASGRTRVVAKLRGLHEPEPGLANASAWGRFEGVADVDALGDGAFRERVRHTTRRLSTLHFLREGAWVWLIPLRGGVTSVGIVCEAARWRPEWRTPEGLLGMLREQRALAELLADAKAVDTGAYARLAYRTKRFFSRDRWGCTGESACFTDPFYSPGADFIALENDMLCDLVERDRAGESLDAVGARADLYDAFMRMRQEAALRLYRGQYGLLGSYELCKLKWDNDVGAYYNLWVDAYMRDLHLDEAWLRGQLAQQPFVLRALDNFAALFAKVEAEVRRRGTYHARNAGEWNNGRDCLWFMGEVGQPRDEARVLALTEEIFQRVFARAAALHDEGRAPASRPPRALASFLGPKPLL
ncbi:MAG: tryptophan 7-halogenase [Myxococcales bacterium]|nr:tryptophan 7-halogenase [Myxococcales bacterium]